MTLKWFCWNSMELGGIRYGESRVPWSSMEYSMGDQENLRLIEITSKFHGIPWNPVVFDLAALEFYGIPWSIPWNRFVIWNGSHPPTQFHGIPWNSMKFDLAMQKFHEIPWNSVECSIEILRDFMSNQVTISMFHEISWNSVISWFAAPEFHGIQWNIPWDSMKYSMKFHWISCHSTFQGTFIDSRNSMEPPNWVRGFHGIPLSLVMDPSSIEHLKCHGIPWNFSTGYEDSMEFQGVLWNLVLASSSMGLLNFPYDIENAMEIPWNCEILILINFIIRQVCFTVCCMISYHCISDYSLVVGLFKYHSSETTFWCPSFRWNGDNPF